MYQVQKYLTENHTKDIIQNDFPAMIVLNTFNFIPKFLNINELEARIGSLFKEIFKGNALP